MKICIYGAGAVGGHLAARIERGGGSVSMIARGQTLEVLSIGGLRVETTDGIIEARPQVSSSPIDLGPQDVVFVTVKAPSLPSVAQGIVPLLNDETLVVFLMNGIPWWYFQGQSGRYEGTPLPKLDPGGAMRAAISTESVIGGVAYTACSVVEPGMIAAINPRNRIIMGCPDGRTDQRLEQVASVMRSGGLEVETTSDIRDSVWEKLLMNIVGGSLGVITGSAMGIALRNPSVRAFAVAIAEDGRKVAAAFGCNPGDVNAGLTRLAASRHRQSVLQDLEAGRPMEIDALLVLPAEMAKLAGVSTPALDLAVSLAAERARAAGLYS